MSNADNQNIFSALFKWGDAKKRIEEDFYTKSLVLILDRLLVGDVHLVRRFLRDVSGFSPDTNHFSISAHVGSENRPDIRIRSRTTFFIIEVKVSAPTDELQLTRYMHELQDSPQQNVRLLLLTKKGQEEDWGTPDRQFSWAAVWRHLATIEAALSSSSGEPREPYGLVRDFRLFLKEQGMGIENVDRILDRDSFVALVNLLELSKQACIDALGVSGRVNAKADTGPEWLGHYYRYGKGKYQYWCGFFKQETAQLVFEFHGGAYNRLLGRLRRTPDLKTALSTRYRGGDGVWHDQADSVFLFHVGLPESFVDLPAEAQLTHITTAIRTIMRDTKEQRARTPANP